MAMIQKILTLCRSSLPSSSSSSSSSTDSDEKSIEHQKSSSSTTSSTITMVNNDEENIMMMKPKWQPKRHLNCCGCDWFHLGKQWQNYRNKRRNEDEIKLLLIGLDNAGKTTLALHLAGESVDDVVSTIGFSKYELRLRQNRFKIVLYDVGGSARIRSIWHNYYSLVHGIIFVIDSADLERILEVKQLLQELASNPLILGKPILIFLNKQDIPEAMDEIDLCKFTNFEEILSKYQCITKIESISAKKTAIHSHNSSNESPHQIDSTIDSGLRWLLNWIDDQWPLLNLRVEQESRQQISKENDTMRKRINRIQQRILIEAESKVPNTIAANNETKSIIIDHQPKSIDNIDNNRTNDNENISSIDNENIGHHHHHHKPEILLIPNVTNEQPTTTTTTTTMDESISTKSPTDSTQSIRPPLKRTNKIYPQNID
ncbi:hypothetical protein DERP_005090 [Dermatophagoides pteronyssinus]|uniref:Uncharacterized protein n=2 Tax=Dermatophagoides pteronyssinus TaxID=6956 RepID=A0ABQ8JTC7_DERPT|nr:ADP-ribosylation factor-like protein 13B [Dermatophagoides pteronyssinus]KAH9425871.1 hypothetical protein DERP_005090 [Dermatophagoides pteronyssinus]